MPVCVRTFTVFFSFTSRPLEGDRDGDSANGPVAQRLEQGTHNPLVPGSNPGGPSLSFAHHSEDFETRADC